MFFPIPAKAKAILARPESTWNRFWFSGGSAECLTRFRIIHGFSLLLFLGSCWRYGAHWLGDAGFHDPGAAVPPLPKIFLPAFAALQFSSALAFVLGWRTRWVATVSWACLLYVTLADRYNAFSINNIYLFSLGIFALFPTGGSSPSKVTAPIRLLQLGMVAIYFSSGWHKIVYGDWIDSPTTLESILQGTYMTDFAAWALRTMPEWIWTPLQYGVVAYEVSAPLLFYSRKWLPVALVFGVVLHAGIALCMKNLVCFGLQMSSFYLLFPTPLRFTRREGG